MQTTDIVIVGAGPVGLFAIFQCGMLGLKCHVIDALETVGGQCAALYPEKPIYDIPAWPRITGADLIEQLRRQAEPFAPVYHLRQTVNGLRRQGEYWELTTSAGARIQAKAVILAAGAGAFGPNRPPLDNIAEYEETGVIQYCVRRIEDYRGKKVVIAGGGDSAVDWALALQPVAASIAIVHRRDKFRATPDSVAKLHNLAAIGALTLAVPYQLHKLHGESGVLETVTIVTLDGREQNLQADILLPFYGLSMDLGPIAEWGLNIERHHIAVDFATCTTNRPGIFAVGDIATYPHKLKLILCGFAEAAQAAHAAYKLVRPEKELHFSYSTSKGVPVAA